MGEWMLRWLACGALMCAAGAAQAGRPLSTDDAATIPPGECQMESWYQSADDAREAHLAPGCGVGETVEVGVRPGLARAMVGSVDESRLGDFKRSLTPQPATILSLLGLIVLDAKADIEAADTRFKALRFDRAEIEAGTVKTVASRHIVGGLMASLLQRLELTPRVLNLPLDLGGLTRALGSLLAPIGPALDALLNPVFDLLGLRFGEADVQVHGLSCPDQGGGLPRLVG